MAKKKRTATTLPSEAPSETAPETEGRLVAWREIAPSPRNPRKSFSEEEIAELAESIAAQGLLQNLTLRPIDNAPTLEIVAGERRWRAIRILVEAGRWDADAPLIPAMIRRMSDEEALVIALIENLHRQDVPPLEEAEGFAELRRLDPERWTTAAIAARVNRTQRYVQQRLALVEKLDDQVKDALRAGQIDVTHARALAVAPAKDQRAALEKIKAGHYGWTDPDAVSAQMLQKLPLVTSAFFDLDRYTGEIVDGPAPYGRKDGRRFADKVQFEALQKEAVQAKRAQLAEKWAWVEVKRGYPVGEFTRSSDRAKAGAVIYVQPEGVVIKTGLVKRKQPAEESWEDRNRRESEAHQARHAAEQRFLLALGERVAGDPLLAMRLLLADLLGGDLLCDNASPTPMTRAFRAPLAAVLEEEDPTGNCRLREAPGAQVLAALQALQGEGDASFRLLAALVAEHLGVNWGRLSPVLAQTAEDLGIAIPPHLLEDEDAIDEEEPDLADEAAQ